MEIFLQGLRVAFAFCLYFLTLACYLAPILVVKCWGSKTLSITSPNKAIRTRSFGLRVISYCNCFAAGVYLAMCFLALIPYANEKFQLALVQHESKIRFPLPECIVVLGFLLTLFVEQLIISWRDQRDTFPQRDDAEQGQGLLDECEMQDVSDDSLVPAVFAETAESSVDSVINKNQNANSAQENHLSTTNTVMASNDIDIVHACSQISLTHRENGFLFCMLALASAFHSTFQGVALGLQTDIPKAVHLFVAIIFHECLIAAALGMNSMRLHYSFMSYLKFAVVFSSSIPLGLIIGIAVGKAPSAGGELASAVLQGLIAGVFLHVVFQDFLPSQFLNRGNRILKVFFVSLGFISIAAATYFIGEL